MSGRPRPCGHMNENGPHPWNWTVCGKDADPRSDPGRPRCAKHLTEENR